jgi:hypothetical protein
VPCATREAGSFSSKQSPGMYCGVRLLESFLTDLEHGAVRWCLTVRSFFFSLP